MDFPLIFFLWVFVHMVLPWWWGVDVVMRGVVAVVMGCCCGGEVEGMGLWIGMVEGVGRLGGGLTLLCVDRRLSMLWVDR